MPAHLIPRKSGVHRTACFALSHALLRQVKQLPLSESHQNTVREQIKTVIKRNVELQGQHAVSTALNLGYEALDALRSETRWQRMFMGVLKLGGQRSAKQRHKTSQGQASAIGTPTRPTRPRVAPYPGASKILDRPFLNLSGRRHIPVVVNANRVPMLRLKKPQSPLLSRIIRDQVNTREARILLSNKLDAEVPVARDEDTWDSVLSQSFGLHPDNGEELWASEINRALHHLHEEQDAAIRKRKAIAERMHEIVEKERALAEEEKVAIRDEKHKARKARRLIRTTGQSLSDPEQIAAMDTSAPEDIIRPGYSGGQACARQHQASGSENPRQALAG